MKGRLIHPIGKAYWTPNNSLLPSTNQIVQRRFQSECFREGRSALCVDNSRKNLLDYSFRKIRNMTDISDCSFADGAEIFLPMAISNKIAIQFQTKEVT